MAVDAVGTYNNPYLPETNTQAPVKQPEGAPQEEQREAAPQEAQEANSTLNTMGIGQHINTLA